MSHNLEPLLNLLNDLQQRLTATRNTMTTPTYETKTIYFPDSGDTVIATKLPNGDWGVYRDDEDEGRYRGFGKTILEAIADMVEQLSGE